MANTNQPFGFSEASRQGAAPNYQQTSRFILASNGTPIYFGDPVQEATGTTGLGTGYLKQASPSQSLAISGFTLANGIVTATFAPTTAPAVGGSLVLTGLTTATTLNGVWTILSSTVTTATFAYSGAALSTQATTGTVYVPVVGIFCGCEYYSVAQKKPFWSRYWTGSDAPAGSNVSAYVTDDPQVVFRVQGNGQITQAMVGGNINFAIGTGNASNGVSGASIDTTTAGPQSYLPFRVGNLIVNPPGAPGTDSTTAYNWAYVSFNFQANRSLTGI